MVEMYQEMSLRVCVKAMCKNIPHQRTNVHMWADLVLSTWWIRDEVQKKSGSKAECLGLPPPLFRSALWNPLLITRLTFVARFRLSLPDFHFHSSVQGWCIRRISACHMLVKSTKCRRLLWHLPWQQPRTAATTLRLQLAKCVMSDGDTDMHWEKYF